MAGYHHLLTQTVVIQRCLDVTDYGDPVYGECETIPAAVMDGFSQVRDSDGSERTSTHQVVTAVPVDVKDRIWLPDENPNDESVAHMPLATRADQGRDTGLRLYQTFL